MSTSRVSIALCTFNGERFLTEQLNSYLQQTELPDELVVCDDASRDGTVDLLRAFQARAPFPVVIHVNSSNVGANRNFEQALRLASGEWILLSDQDDVWSPHKVARLRAAFREEPERRFWATNATIVAEDGRPRGDQLWARFPQPLRKRFREADAVGTLFSMNRVTGATCAVHASLLDRVLPFEANDACLHDYWIAFVAAAIAPCGLIDEPLMEYRQHPGQQVGAPLTDLRQRIAAARRRDEAYFLAHAAFFEALHIRLSATSNRLRRPDILSRLEEKTDQCRVQARMRTVNRLHRAWLVLSQAGRYARSHHGLTSAAIDLLL